MSSRVAELAREEAERVEAEEAAQAEAAPEAPDEPETPAEPEPKPQRRMSEEAQIKAFEKLLTRHSKALQDLFGEEWAGMHACMLCNGVGFTPEVPLRAHPETHGCQKCGGHGQLLTGAQPTAQGQVACDSCQGTGYTYRMPEPPPATSVTPSVVYYDSQTGLPVQPQPQQAPLPAHGSWAPGHVPQGQPLVQAPPQT